MSRGVGNGVRSGVEQENNKCVASLNFAQRPSCPQRNDMHLRHKKADRTIIFQCPHLVSALCLKATTMDRALSESLSQAARRTRHRELEAQRGKK